MALPYVSFSVIDKSGYDAGGDYHSFIDYGLILSKQEIGVPPVKTKSIDIEGAQGSIDMTEAFDEIFYKDRTLTFTFNTVTNLFSWEQIRTQMANDLHGRQVRIQIYSDEDFYYTGRCFIDKYQSSKGLGTIVVKCTCEPFKIQLEKSEKTFELSETTIETQESTISFEGHSIQIYCDATNAIGSASFTIDGTTKVVLAGQGAWFPKKVRKPFNGTPTITVKGKGTVLIQYQERCL